MKALALYIDKWYIIGAICTDDVPRLIRPKNNEECFWLYFYEDVANDEIVYGKDNKRHFHNNENHYLGDIFKLLVDGKSYFRRYGHKQGIGKIFKASGILDEFKDAIGNTGEKIETYISFARDISDAARVVFLKEVLLPENFDIKESVARIGHLALEDACRKNIFHEDGYYLLLNACNENLIYSLYEFKDGLFLRKAEKSLPGMGTDLRNRALLESVVKSINQRNHFLKSEEEFEDEYLRLSQYIDDWIVRLENARPGRPITIPNVSFANIGNSYQATILKKDIDSRTHVIVDDVIREIVSFVRENRVDNITMKGVLFLGNTFTNSQFLTAIKEQYTLPDSSYVYYSSKDLPTIVAVYTKMDCSQFSAETQYREEQGEAELERQKLAREDEQRRLQAEALRKEQIEKEHAAQKAERSYEEAMRMVYDLEKKQDYAQMIDWVEIALTHKPGDSEATQKKSEAIRLLSEQKVKEEQYRTIIGRAQTSLNKKQWQDALSQSEAALNIKPSSVEAKRIYDEAKKHIEILKEIDKYINRADLFFAQKLYDEALRELNKVLSLDKDNQDAGLRVKEIETIQLEHKNNILALEDKYNNSLKIKDFDSAIEACEKLAELDAINQRVWTSKAEKLKADKAKIEEELKRFQDLNKKAMDADFREDWSSFLHYATEALAIMPSEELSKRIERAKKKLESKNKEEEYQRLINDVKVLIKSGSKDEANKKLNSLQKDFPEHTKEIQELRQQTFDWGENTKRPPIVQGFKVPKDDPKVKPSFFEDDTPRKKQNPQTQRHMPQRSSTNKNPSKPTGIDFFDMDFNPKIK